MLQVASTPPHNARQTTLKFDDEPLSERRPSPTPPHGFGSPHRPLTTLRGKWPRIYVGDNMLSIFSSIYSFQNSYSAQTQQPAGSWHEECTQEYS
jgi:hypothetical protein